MSRHEFNFRHNDKLLTMAIGWDVPLQSFFYTVYDPEQNEPHNIIADVGLNGIDPPIATLEQLGGALGEYISYVTPEIAGTLLGDKMSSAKPSPYQERMLNMLKGIADE